MPALTPVIAHDATHLESASVLTDLSGGGRHANMAGQLAGLDGTMVGVRGNGSGWTYARVTRPATGVFVGMISNLAPRVMMFSDYSQPGNPAALLIENDVVLLGPYGQVRCEGSAFNTAMPDAANVKFVAIIFDPTGFQFYYNGVMLGTKFGVPLTLTTTTGSSWPVTWGLNATLHGMGMFSGVATVTDIQTMEAELRSAMVITGVGVTGLGDIAILSPGTASVIPGTNFTGGVIGIRREWAGSGSITGNVGLVDAALTPCRVVLFTKAGNYAVSETTSDAVGDYHFDGVNTAQEHYVVVFKAGITGAPALTAPVFNVGSQVAAMAYIGPGHVSGILKVVAAPAVRTVRLYDRLSGQLIRTTKSDAGGAFRFDNLELGRKYLAVGQDEDYPVKYNAAVADFLEAVL